MRCPNAECQWPDAPCFRRVEPTELCPDLGARPALGATTAPAQVPAAPRASRLWSGASLGADEAAELFVARRPRLIVVAGREDAGKTCLVTAQYMAIANGGAFGWRFCHSRSLRGFEALSDAAWEWSGAPEDRILPRTGGASHREAGYLHLALKQRLLPGSSATADGVHDVVLTDMPGEWFERWADSKDYASRLPFLPRADVVWAVLDLPKILNERGARSRAGALLDRAVTSNPGRPLAVVLTKADRASPPEDLADPCAWGAHEAIFRRLYEPLQRHTGARATFAVSAFPARPGEAPPRGVLDPLHWSLMLPKPIASAEAPRVGPRYFSCFREARP
jgi:hypothetical protein